MKKIFGLILILVSFSLIACSNDIESNRGSETKISPIGSTPASLSQQEEILLKHKEWLQYKNSLGGDYQMSYRDTGFTPNANINFLVKVHNHSILASGDVNGNRTMDDLFNTALEISKHKSCALRVSFDSNQPILKSYTAFCGPESYGIEIISFSEEISEDPDYGLL